MMARVTKCADIRDRVFGVLGFARDCSDGKGLQADYSWTTTQLSANVLAFCKPEERVMFTHQLSLLLHIDVNTAARLAFQMLLSPNSS